MLTVGKNPNPRMPFSRMNRKSVITGKMRGLSMSGGGDMDGRKKCGDILGIL